MENKTYHALVVTEENGQYMRQISERNIADLPAGDILIKVHYSSLNYKDALSATGNKGVTRHYPHTPGIDAAGIVEASDSSAFSIGDSVFITGYDLGMNTSGGFGEYIRVPAEWVVKCPDGLTLKESMLYGTAGFTAALSVYEMISAGVKPEDGEILVTGATGGVGSIAIRILSHLNYQVIAATGKQAEKDWLQAIGAKDIISRQEITDASSKPMLRSRWAGVIDTVGGDLLATALKTTAYGGCVTCCGNVAAHSFNASVYPFILRGIRLIGIDSVQCPMPLRQKVWSKLSGEWKIDSLPSNSQEISLYDLDKHIDLMLQGKHVGRSIVSHE